MIPLVAVAVAQIAKFIIGGRRGQFRIKDLLAYGGMPSAHTAFVVSLGTATGLQEGWDSPAFAIAVVFGLLIIRDAVGLRQLLGEHGRILNMLIVDLPDDIEAKYPHGLLERVGHTPLQATVGGIIGLILGYVLHVWWLG